MHLERALGNRLLRVDEPAEFADDLAVADFHRADFDDSGRARVAARRFQIERDVAAERLRHVRRADGLHQLEQRHDRRKRRDNRHDGRRRRDIRHDDARRVSRRERSPRFRVKADNHRIFQP